MNAAGLLAHEAWLEQDFWAAETLRSNGDDVAIRQFVSLLLVTALRCSLHLAVKVQGDVAKFLLDVSNNLALSGGGEGVAALSEDLHHVLRKVTTSQVQTQNGMRQSIALIDGHGVAHTVATVHHNSGGSARCIQGQHSLDCNIHCRHVEGLEHDLSHAFTVGLWVQGSFSQQDWMLFRSYTQLVVEGVMPNLLHVIPIGDDAVLNGILQGQHTSLALRLVSYIAVLLVHANHDSRHLWPANNGWENCSWSIITCKAGLAHSASVVHHKRGNFFVTHGCENKGVLKGVAK
mmetsp:Transcript_22655/g.49540  ORF Transcript_22655/g.49540 Transcript_22655/m.49540 type:complete len:290 (-) Transcript_22655:52-921(-)